MKNKNTNHTNVILNLFQDLQKNKMLKQVQHDSTGVVQNNAKDKNGKGLINLSTYRLIDFKKILRLKPQDDVTLVPACPSALKPLKKKAAFTLAETLITLGIIGVVAALTIPGLINNYKAQRLRSQFLKSYSTVQQVFKQMEADDVSLDPNSYNASEFYTVFARYLSGASLCKGSTEKSPLCPNAQTRANNLYKGISNWYLDDGAISLQDGTLLMFENTVKTANPYVFVTVDLNGIKNPPNMEGFDVFTFHFQDGILRTMGDKGTLFQGDEYCDLDKVRTTKEVNNFGVACAQKAKEDADYFKKLVKKYK